MKELLDNEKYLKRWNFVPKKTDINEFIAKQVEKDKDKNPNSSMDNISYVKISLDDLEENPYNLRDNMKDGELEKLAESMLELGQIQMGVKMSQSLNSR